MLFSSCERDEPRTSDDFSAEAFRLLPLEEPYQHHKTLKEGPVHSLRRDANASATPAEIEIGAEGWKLLVPSQADSVLRTAAEDFRDYLDIAMKVRVEMESLSSLDGWRELDRAIVVGTARTLPGCGAALHGPKDYALEFSQELVVVCGFDERGAAQGLYNLESRMSLREGPFLQRDFQSTRRSLYRTRMVLNWLGWMEWPDAYLSRVAHAGYDAIYASIYANPNGAEGTAHYVMVRRQDPERMKDLLARASRYGISVYTPILYRFTGNRESEAGLRDLMRDILSRFPEIRGYVLLTEGFFYDEWFGAGGHGSVDLREWANNWCRAVAIVAEECHRVDPEIEVLPWEYNIDFRPQQVELKRYFIQQLPQDVIPLVTWENGKSFEIDGLKGYVTDYSISQVGPSEVAAAQIAEAHRRGMRVYTKADTFASWQFGTLPYLPTPYQWQERYRALQEHRVDGVLESWSFGYTPNFISELRAWTSWTEAPPIEELLPQIARRDFGSGSETLVLDAWRRFSSAIRLVPDMGPRMGTNFSPGNPLFFDKPPARTMTIEHSWWDQALWKTHRASRIDPLWPFTRASFTFIPDFTNRVNMAEEYARRSTGIARMTEPERLDGVSVLPTYQRLTLQAADEFEAGLRPYREAARQAPDSKRYGAFREVLLVEQMQRTLRSSHAILTFEDFRFRLGGTSDPTECKELLNKMVRILREEIARTKASLETARRDSRIGYELEMDYVYDPHVLEEKLKVLRAVLEREIPAYGRKHGI